MIPPQKPSSMGLGRWLWWLAEVVMKFTQLDPTLRVALLNITPQLPAMPGSRLCPPSSPSRNRAVKAEKPGAVLPCRLSFTKGAMADTASGGAKGPRGFGIALVNGRLLDPVLREHLALRSLRTPRLSQIGGMLRTAGKWHKILMTR